MFDPERESERSTHINSRRLRAASVLVAGATTGLFILGQFLGYRNIEFIASIAAAVTALLGSLFAVASRREFEKQIEEKESLVDRIEAPPPEPESTVALLDRHIELAIGQEEITMLRAERRANNLYTIGQMFLVASVLGPIIAGAIYVTVDPLPPETVEHLKELKAELGDLPSQTCTWRSSATGEFSWAA